MVYASRKISLLIFLTKICFVVLEKLDEKRINQYLEKCCLKNITKNFGSINNAKPQSINKNVVNCNGCFKTKKNSKTNRRRKWNYPKDSVAESELERRKRKIRVLSYTDNVSVESVFEKEPVIEDDDTTISDLIDNREESCSGLKKTYENDNSATMKYKKKSTSEVEVKKNMILKALLKDSGCCKFENNVAALAGADTETEIVEEYLSPRNNFQNKNCDKTEAIHYKEQLLVNSDSVQAESFEEDEYDLREDSEDDKKTVIFEEEFPEGRDSDIFDIEEKEGKWVRRKLKKREITNRKIRKIIQFKNKSLKDRNSEMMRKPEVKVMEPSIEQEATEDVSEDSLKEVCCLVQNLYELYRIILYMQMELQKDKRLSVHFSRAINAQQEQFQREIRKSQETIIKCYEKMLLSYKNADKVALIISKRTSLSAEEVIEVISQCLFVEGAGELRKSEKELIQKAGKEKASQPHKALCNSDNSGAINENSEELHEQKMVQEINYLLSPSHSYYPSEKNQELCQRLTNESMLMSRIPARENSKISSKNSSDRVIGISPPPYQMPEHEKLQSSLIQKKMIQKLHSSNVTKNSGISQSQQMQCEPLLVLPSNDHLKNGLAFSDQSVIPSYPKSDRPTNVSQFQRGSLLAAPATPGRNTGLHYSGQLMSCNLESSSADHVNRSNNNLLNSRSRVSVPVVAGNIAQCNSLPHQSNSLNGAFPAKTCNGLVNNQRQILVPSNETSCPLNVALVNSARLPNQKFFNFLPNGLFLRSGEMAESRFRVEGNTRTELGNVPSRVPKDSQVLDPTVPKKLTMKNWRLQAGPILNLKAEEEKVTESRDKLNPCQSLERKKHGCRELGNPYQEDYRAREYICAQNNCRKPGVRICKDCQSIIYCSETCQLKNWTQKHMVECYQLKKLRG